jgi:hypothetical protein
MTASLALQQMPLALPSATGADEFPTAVRSVLENR